MRLGGSFLLEQAGKKINTRRENSLYAMSGRCAIYACLKDLGLREGSIAYLPAYTCETVMAPYVKAGCALRFYDVDPDGLRPVFKEEDLEGVSVMNLCAYYGFLTYSRSFLPKVKERGITIIQDTTHSPTYIDPYADYAAGSLRKWMGVASGGWAVKKAGPFTVSLLPPEEDHLRGRYLSMEQNREALFDEAAETFWATEMRLRKIFDAYASDGLSVDIIESFDFGRMKEIRRRNFYAVLSAVTAEKGWKPVFTSLGEEDCPSHFTIYVEERDKMRSYLKDHDISSTVYWPESPFLKDRESFTSSLWVMAHVLSVPLDQRYTEEDMRYLGSVLSSYRP